MHNNFVLIPWNRTLLIGLDYWNKTFWDIHNNLFFTKSYIIVNLWYRNLEFDKTYSAKGYLVLVIPGVVSIDQVPYQNPQLYSTGIMLWIPWKWKLRRLKIEKSILVVHNPHRLLVRWLSPQYWTLNLVGCKGCFTWSLLCHFQFLVSFKWFVIFASVPIDPHYFASLGTWRTRHYLYYISNPTYPNKCFVAQFKLFWNW